MAQPRWTSAPARAHARLAFRDRDGKPEFERGALRFDDRALSLPATRGLQIDGDWPDFDLGRWLALGGDAPARRTLSDWLGPVNVRLARARLYGYELRDVAAVLAASDRHWQVDLTGPQAAGRVTVPFDLKGGAPVVLDMQRLHLAVRRGCATPTRASTADPRRMPALTVSADEFVWQGRRLGRVRAEIVREPQGLRLRKFTAHSPALDIAGTGRWFAEGAGSRSELDLEATSTDLARGLGRARVSRCDRGAARLDHRAPHLAGRADARMRCGSWTAACTSSSTTDSCATSSPARPGGCSAS